MKTAVIGDLRTEIRMLKLEVQMLREALNNVMWAAKDGLKTQKDIRRSSNGDPRLPE